VFCELCGLPTGFFLVVGGVEISDRRRFLFEGLGVTLHIIARINIILISTSMKF
jgi:hypothetical protein